MTTNNVTFEQYQQLVKTFFDDLAETNRLYKLSEYDESVKDDYVTSEQAYDKATDDLKAASYNVTLPAQTHVKIDTQSSIGVLTVSIDDNMEQGVSFPYPMAWVSRSELSIVNDVVSTFYSLVNRARREAESEGAIYVDVSYVPRDKRMSGSHCLTGYVHIYCDGCQRVHTYEVSRLLY